MIINILNGNWTIQPINDSSVLMHTGFPERVIKYNLNNIKSLQMFKHCMLHELTHAYQAELGQWQNVMGNGRYNDEFDCEWIAEFVAIYSEVILAKYKQIEIEIYTHDE